MLEVNFLNRNNTNLETSLDAWQCICYAQSTMPVERKPNSQPIPDDSEMLLATKEQILDLWQSLPDEHRATLATTMLDSVMSGEYRLWFQVVIANRWPLTTEQLDTTYPHIQLSELDLQRANLPDEAIARLSPEHRDIMAQMMRLNYIHNLFWPELRQTANAYLENLDDIQQWIRNTIANG